jgi:hypothetical protein
MDEIECDDDLQSRSNERIQAIGATLMSLVLAAGVGGWLLLSPGGGPETGQEPAEWALPVLQGDDQSETSAGPWVPGAPVVYLVAMQEHAVAVLIAISGAAAVHERVDATFLDERVVVLDSAEAETWFTLALHEENADRSGTGLPSLRVVDLRAQRWGSYGVAREDPAVRRTGA